MTKSTNSVPISLAQPRFYGARRLLRRFQRSTNVVVGLSILTVLIVLALLAPILSHYDPLEMAPGDRLLPPSQQHLFGTDSFGRDILTRVLYGGQISLQVGLVSVALASVMYRYRRIAPKMTCVSCAPSAAN